MCGGLDDNYWVSAINFVGMVWDLGEWPMWRNGRRNGLKIRSRLKRGMGSTPMIGTTKKKK